ncbi:hypothetical protein H0H93_008720, partial [Arthromyces matolae]
AAASKENQASDDEVRPTKKARKSKARLNMMAKNAPPLVSQPNHNSLISLQHSAHQLIIDGSPATFHIQTIEPETQILKTLKALASTAQPPDH